MAFDSKIHITHKILAEYLGVTSRKLSGEISKFETPLKRAGRTNISGEQVTYYDRTEALEWACLWSQYDAIARRAHASTAQAKHAPRLGTGQKVPPRTPTPFKPLQLDPEMRIAYDRAKAQPPMMTPNGCGDRTRSWGGSRSEA